MCRDAPSYFSCDIRLRSILSIILIVSHPNPREDQRIIFLNELNNSSACDTIRDFTVSSTAIIVLIWQFCTTEWSSKLILDSNENRDEDWNEQS